MSEFVDVIEVEIAAPHRVRVLAKYETKLDAVGVILMAVIRRGVESHFFTTSPAGQYHDGDTLHAEAQPLARARGDTP